MPVIVAMMAPISSTAFAWHMVWQDEASAPAPVSLPAMQPVTIPTFSPAPAVNTLPAPPPAAIPREIAKAHVEPLERINPWTLEEVPAIPPSPLEIDREDPWSPGQSFISTAQPRKDLDRADPWLER
jgi:hypothetical protein